MILDVEEAEVRLNSADNLVNKMKLATSSSREVKKDFTELYGIANSEKASSGNNSISPVLPPSVSDLIVNAEDQIKLGLAYSGAADVLHQSVEMLSRNLVNIDPTKPQVLAKIATEMSRIVTGINEVRSGGKIGNQTQVIIYRPVMMNENHYESVQAHE